MAYTPGRQPQTDEGKDLRDYIEQELSAIAREFAQLEKFVEYEEPKNAKDGQTAFADGTKWNPGAGRGMYLRDGGTWTKIS